MRPQLTDVISNMDAQVNNPPPGVHYGPAAKQKTKEATEKLRSGLEAISNIVV